MICGEENGASIIGFGVYPTKYFGAFFVIVSSLLIVFTPYIIFSVRTLIISVITIIPRGRR